MPQCMGGRPHDKLFFDALDCIVGNVGSRACITVRDHKIKVTYRHLFSPLDSKPVMDLLVTLCASYHLNPSDYTVEVLSPNKNNISFKPNSPIGSLEAETIVLKPRGTEEKIKRPYMPEVKQTKQGILGCF